MYQNLEKNVSDFQVFSFYSERFNAHVRSANIEKRMKKKEQSMRNTLSILGLTPLSSFFWSVAIEQLVLNRNTLACSFAYGYFRKTIFNQNLDRTLFEYRQKVNQNSFEFAHRFFSLTNQFQGTQ